MKSFILMTAVVLLSTSRSEAQIKNSKTETVKVSGNCGMCETTIEKAGNKKKLYRIDWNVDTKMASIPYRHRPILNKNVYGNNIIINK